MLWTLLLPGEQNRSDASIPSLTSSERQWLDEHPVITLGFSSVFEPSLIRKDDGTLAGILPGFYDLIGKRLGITIQIVDDSWPETLRKAESQELDGIAMMSRKTAIERGFLVLNTPYDLYVTAFAKKSRLFTLKNDKDLEHLRVTYFQDIVFLKKYFEDNWHRIESTGAPSILGAFKAILQQRADVVVGFNIDSYQLIKHSIFEIEPVRMLEDIQLTTAIAIRPNAPQLASALAKAVQSITNEERHTILSHWSWIPPCKQVIDLTPQERGWLEKHPVVRLASAHHRLPVEAISQDGVYEGVAADYIKLIEKKTGLKFEVSPIKSWPELVNMVKTKELDMLTAAMELPSRKEFATFIQPFMHHPLVIVTSDKVTFVEDIQSLRGKRIAMPKGFASIEMIRADYPDLDIHTYGNLVEAIKAVSKGEAYAFIGSMILASNTIRDYGIVNVKITGETPYSYDLSMGIRNDWPELVSIMEKAMDTITQEERGKILNRWIAVRVQQEFDYRIVWYLVGGFGLVLLLTGVYIRKQNRHKREIEDLNNQLKKNVELAVWELEQAEAVGNIGTWQYDLQKDKLKVNSVMKQIYQLDYNQEFYSQKELFSTFCPDDLEEIQNAYEQHLINHAPFNIKHRLLMPDGTIKYIHAIATTQCDDHGNPLLSRGISQDITERILYEEELKKSNERNRKALQDLEEQKYALDEHAIVAITNMKGTITYANEKFAQISGYSREELIGSNHRILSSGQHNHEFWKEMYATVIQGDSWHAEVCNKAKDGSFYWVDTTIVPFMGDDGKPKSYIAIRTDITERIHQQEIVRERDHQLMQQSRLAQLGEMISMIAHQWRQPLGAIASTIIDMKMQMELETFDLDSPQGKEAFQKYLTDGFEDIETYVHTLTTTIDDFRSFYKSDKKMTEETITVPIVKAMHIIRKSFEAAGIQVVENHHSETNIKVHENEMIQVFLNLLLNAKDNFIERDTRFPEISVTSRDTDGGVEVKICDNGGGIPDEVLPRIFDPYFSTKEAKHGTGLGLYMSKMIIEEHHRGSLEVQNIHEGACFTIRLTPEGHRNSLPSDEIRAPLKTLGGVIEGKVGVRFGERFLQT